MNKIYNRHFDEDGKIASSGQIIESLLNIMKEDQYFKTPPPKSTGKK